MDAALILLGVLVICLISNWIVERRVRKALKNTVYMVRPKKD
jgi:hypothetical protein